MQVLGIVPQPNLHWFIGEGAMVTIVMNGGYWVSLPAPDEYGAQAGLDRALLHHG